MVTNKNYGLASFGCIAAMAWLVACSEKEKVEDVKPDPAGTATVPTNDSAADAKGLTCPQGTGGAKMVLIPLPDGNAYCIDEREAVYAEYKAFLEAKGENFDGQPAECEANTSFVPGWEDPSHEIPQCSVWLIDSEPDRAVQCLDFCDAWAFCSWAGKRLCSEVGVKSKGLHFVPDDELSQLYKSARSEWFHVCSQGGTTEYPYGNEYEPGKCIDEAKIQTEGESALDVRDTTGNTCHGTSSPYDEVHNMSGSVKQWQNICRTSGCAIQGGSWQTPSNCSDASGVKSLMSVNVGVGVRCCADAVPEM